MQELTESDYIVKIIKLDCGELLISKIVTAKEKITDVENLVCLYEPTNIEISNDAVFYKRWIPPSIDKLYYVPISKILNVSEPSVNYKESYKQYLEKINNDYDEFENDLDEDDFEDEDEELIEFEEIIYH